MERLINLTAGYLHDGNQNPCRFMRLYQVKADRVRNGRIGTLISALTPELAAKKLDLLIPIDTSSAMITEIAAAFQKPIHYPLNAMKYQGIGRRLVNLPSVPAIVNNLSNEYIAGFNDRLSYTGRQKPETRAKNATDAEFFLMGYNAAQRRLNAQKPKKATKRKAKVKVA